jgi:nucleoside 2-deoxyribosyltransferase
MLTVVGGAYREICLRPQWNQLFGSGVRAAAAVSKLASAHGGVELHTWVSPSEEIPVEDTAASYEFQLIKHHRQQAIEFQYDHAIGPPRLFPNRDDLSVPSVETITAQNAVCFSIIEGNFRLQAEKLVYDPQAGRKARTPRDSGHSANTVGIVANLEEVKAMVAAEGARLTNREHAPTIFGKSLLKQEKCSVVVVKNGTEGATVVTEAETTLVPSFVTERVFPIGSGDVFTAVFAYFWLQEDKCPVDAALLASAATAQYCDSRVLPVPTELPKQVPKMKKAPPGIAVSASLQVYLAGPLFTLPQLWLLNEAKRVLEEQGLSVFSPKDEVGFLPNTESAPQIARADLQGLDSSHLVFAILDGLDSGTVFEVGYARAKNKPVIGYAENVKPRALTMLLGTDCRIYEDFSTAVYNTVWTARNLKS